MPNPDPSQPPQQPEAGSAEPPAQQIAPVTLQTASFITSHVSRISILKSMLDGELWSVSDLAKTVALTPTAVSKQMSLLLETGLIVRGTGGLYRLAPRYRTPGARTIDLGHFLIRFDMNDPS